MTAAYSQATNSMKGTGVSNIGGKSTSAPSVSANKSVTSTKSTSSGATYTSSANKAKNTAAAANSKITAGYQQAANSLKGTGISSIGGKTTSAKSGATYTSAANINKNIAVASAYKTAAKLTGPVYTQEATKGLNQIAANKAATATAKISAGYAQAAASFKGTGVANIGGKSISAKSGATYTSAANKAKNKFDPLHDPKLFADIGVETMKEIDKELAKKATWAASSILTKGNAKNFPANAQKAEEYLSKEYERLAKLASKSLPTKLSSASGAAVADALEQRRLITFGMKAGAFGKYVKGFGVAGTLVDPVLGGIDEVGKLPKNASTEDKITAGIVGGLKKADVAVVGGAAGAGAGFLALPSGPATLGAGPVVAAAVGGGYASHKYEQTNTHKSWEEKVDSAAPYIKLEVDAFTLYAAINTAITMGGMMNLNRVIIGTRIK